MNTILSSGIQNIYSPLTVGGKLAGNKEAGKGEGTSFQSLFQDAIQNVEELNKIKSDDSYNLAIGDVDDVAQVMVNAERADVAFQMLVQVRNKVLDAYSEIMRMNV